jgi:hypothetical protein
MFPSASMASPTSEPQLDDDREKNREYTHWSNYSSIVPFESLLGVTLTNIRVSNGSDFIEFTTDKDELYVMVHFQDCCEDVSIEDIVGDIDDLLDLPVLLAEESSSSGDEDDWEHFTWTFYKLATEKGYVTIRWYGTSNGYYSESVDLIKVGDCARA